MAISIDKTAKEITLSNDEFTSLIESAVTKNNLNVSSISFHKNSEGIFNFSASFDIFTFTGPQMLNKISSLGLAGVNNSFSISNVHHNIGTNTWVFSISK